MPTRAVPSSPVPWLPPRRRAIYPYAFRLALTYRLRDGLLLLEAVVENPGPDPLPFHLATTLYFRMPVHPEGDRRRCRMRVPSAATRELANLCATGRRLPMAPGTAYDPSAPRRGDDGPRSPTCPEPDTGRVVCWARSRRGDHRGREHDPETFPVFVVYTRGRPLRLSGAVDRLPGGLGDDTPAGQGARRVPWAGASRARWPFG